MQLAKVAKEEEKKAAKRELETNLKQQKERAKKGGSRGRRSRNGQRVLLKATDTNHAHLLECRLQQINFAECLVQLSSRIGES